MRAVKCKNNYLSLINTFEVRLYSMAETVGSLDSTQLSERDVEIAEEMYRKNVFDKQSKNGKFFYTTYSTKQNL